MSAESINCICPIIFGGKDTKIILFISFFTKKYSNTRICVGCDGSNDRCVDML